MKTMALILITVLFLVFSVTVSQAQNLKVGINLGGVVPMSDLKDVAAPGGGGDIYLGYKFSQSWMGLVQVGFHKFGSEEVISGVDVKGGLIPIKIGFTKFWGERFHTGPSFGLYKGTSDFDSDGADVSDFGMGPRIGYLFPLGGGGTELDLAIEYHNVFADPDNLTYFGINLGIVFSLGGESYTMRTH